MAATDFPPGDFSPGDVLAKRYEVTDFLGHGGMGFVYGARDLTNGARVAIKLPRREVRSRKKALARFERESRTAARLSGPHVVRVTDVRELDDGTPFIVMELLVGKDLANVIDARGALSVHEAVNYVLQASSGVAEAHAAGIVHRDLKPHNLFLVGDTVKVLDFGISKIGGGEVARMTTTNARLGTPLYVSPEQLVSAKYVDARSDIWSLGVILYELLTGTLPFEGPTAIAVAAAIQTVEPVPPSARKSGIPPELDRVVMKALSKSAATRFQDVAEFARALAPFSAPGSIAPRIEAPRPAPAPLRAGETQVDSPREDSTADQANLDDIGDDSNSLRSPVPAPRETHADGAPSPLLLVLAALFGIALLALALAYR